MVLFDKSEEGGVRMELLLPGTMISVSQSHLEDVDQVFRPMFLSGGLQLRQVVGLLGTEAHTVQNWVKRGFVDSPVKKFYDQERFVRLALLNYYKDVFSLEEIILLLNMVRQDSMVYSALCLLLAHSPIDPIRAETKFNEMIEEAMSARSFDYKKTSKEQVRRLLTILYTAHLSIVLKREAVKMAKEI